MLRRNFIRIGTASLGTMVLRRFAEIPALAQPASDYRALVCVFLYGGNDSNNTIVSLDNYANYSTNRGVLAIPQTQLLQIIPKSGTTKYGLHPNLTAVDASEALDQLLHRLGVAKYTMAAGPKRLHHGFPLGRFKQHNNLGARMKPACLAG